MIVKGHKIGPRADLRGVDLSGENLTGANLSGTNLRGANLYGANLSDANLSDVNLIGANLSYANLRGANLVRAYLSWANLCGTNLSDANLKWADLPPPTTVLMAEWGKLSDSLTADLMAYDAACHPDPSAFDKWAKITDGPCPYDCIKVQRAAQFKESRRLWDPARPLRRPYDLMADVIREKCSFSDFH